ncbi:alpha/beta hydrolase [Myxococcota bacterium]|nr:alpha/beta hydrolase [Myxococcota bacterium]
MKLHSTASLFLLVLLGFGSQDALAIEAARAMSGQTGQVDREGRSIGYASSGSGTIVVMLASMGRSASDLNELGARLVEAGYRTLAIDAPGIGASGTNWSAPPSVHDYAADIEYVLRAAGLPEGERVFVLGHAYGNRIARAFATDFPDRVEATILLAAGGRVPGTAAAHESFPKIFDPTLPNSVRAEAVGEAFFAQGNRVPDEWISGWYGATMLAQVEALQRASADRWWPGGRAPILVVQPGEDALAPPANAALLRDEFPHRVRVVEIPKAGHALLPEQPQAVAKAVLEFLEAQKWARR